MEGKKQFLMSLVFCSDFLKALIIDEFLVRNFITYRSETSFRKFFHT